MPRARRLRGQGSLSRPAAESDARETLPAAYHDRASTRLRASVSEGATVHDFALRSDAKGR